jgi:hypothetical protein
MVHGHTRRYMTASGAQSADLLLIATTIAMSVYFRTKHGSMELDRQLPSTLTLPDQSMISSSLGFLVNAYRK